MENEEHGEPDRVRSSIHVHVLACPPEGDDGINCSGSEVNDAHYSPFAVYVYGCFARHFDCLQGDVLFECCVRSMFNPP